MTVRNVNLAGSASQVVVVTAAILAAQAIGGIILARSLGPADRGILAALVLWAATASDIANVGTPNTVSYWAASGTPRHGLRILRRALPWMAAVSLVLYFAIVLVSGRWDELPLLGVLVMAAWAVGQLVHLPLQRYQQGSRNMSSFNGLRLIAELGPAIGYATFAAVGLLSVATGAVSITGMMFAALAAGFVLARRSPHTAESTSLLSEERRRFWSYSGRSWLSILAGRSNRTIDLLILTLLAVAAEDIGFYAVAVTSTGVIAVLGGSLGLDLFPKIAAIEEGGDGRPLLRKFIGVNAVFSLVAAVVFFVIADWLIPFVYSNDFAPAVGPARVLLFGVVAVSISQVAGQGLAGMGHPGQPAVAQVVGAVVTLVGVLSVGTRSLELVAIAASSGFVVTTILMLVFTWRAAHRKYA
ncbi:MAG: lipopolysaccharide biosynthesis protein [Acidimicrobiales bacterium]